MSIDELRERARELRAYASRSSSWWSSNDDRRAAEKAASEAEQAYYDAIREARS